MHPSMLNQDQSMPFRQSYSNRPAFHISKKTPARTYSWKRSWAVEPGQNLVASSAFHWQPVRRTKKMASAQRRSGGRGGPPPQGGGLTGAGRQVYRGAQGGSGACPTWGSWMRGNGHTRE